MRRFISVLAICAMGVCAAPAAAQTDPFKTFALTVGPDPVGQGQTVTFEATITNTAKGTQKIGAVNIAVPKDIQNPMFDGKPVVDRTVELRSLALAPTASRTVQIIGTVPSEIPRHVWTARAKSSNTFESTSEWTLTSSEADRDTNALPSSCEGQETCTARHYVSLDHVKTFDPSAGGGNYYVDTTITLDPIQTDTVRAAATGREVSVEYLDPHSQANADSACDGLVTYREPSDAAALFYGVGPKTVTFSLSPDLARVLYQRQAPQSCLSAPALFEPEFSQADAPFAFENELWFNGLLHGCEDPDRLRDDSPCVDDLKYAQDAWSVVIDFPESDLFGPDPMNR